MLVSMITVKDSIGLKGQMNCETHHHSCLVLAQQRRFAHLNQTEPNHKILFRWPLVAFGGLWWLPVAFAYIRPGATSRKRSKSGMSQPSPPDYLLSTIIYDLSTMPTPPGGLPPQKNPKRSQKIPRIMKAGRVSIREISPICCERRPARSASGSTYL